MLVSRVTRWDAVVFLRAALVAGLALVLACLVTAATDEGGVPWGERAGRTLPLTPVCAAVGAWGALAPVRSRGEVRALEALGRSRTQIAAPAIAGAAAVAVVAALLVGGVRSVDITGFYPAALHTAAWHWEGETFVNRGAGLRVQLDGALAVEEPGTGSEPPPPERIPPHGRAAASLATALAGLALPMLLSQLLLVRHAGTRRERLGRQGEVRAHQWPAIAASGVAVVGSLMLFQAAAARLVPALSAALPPAALLAFAVERSRSSS